MKRLLQIGTIKLFFSDVLTWVERKRNKIYEVDIKKTSGIDKLGEKTH